MDKADIFFRADGNSRIGLGHIIRSLALAEMLKNEFQCHFIIQNPSTYIQKQILKNCQSFIELPLTDLYENEALWLAEKYLTGKEIMVLDGYNFKTQYQQIIKNKGCKVVCIDDIHTYHFVADAVINHAGGLSPKDYSAEQYTELYIGLKYVLLRKPFREAAKKRIRSGKEDGIFICFGGADPNNDTLNVLKICEQSQTKESCYVIVGEAYQHMESLTDFIETSSLNITLLSNIDASKMVKYMQKCSVAVTPPSTVSYEYLSIGGVLFLKLIAENQKDIKRYLIEEGLALDFDKDFSGIVNSKYLLKKNIQKQKELFDGFQEKRFSKLFKYLSLEYREATMNDCLQYFEWANEPEVRKQSYSSYPIKFENHKKWFKNKVMAENTRLFLISLGNQPIGQIRFDIEDFDAKISYSLDRKFRGKGYGDLLLKKGVTVFRNILGDHIRIIGYVKMENIASVKAFKSLGFSEEISEETDKSYKYIL